MVGGCAQSQAARLETVLSEDPQIVITEPVDGSVVAPLDEVTVTVEPLDGFPLAELGIFVPEITFSDHFTEPPFTTTFVVPEDYEGTLEITAIGNDGESVVTISDPVSITVDPDFSELEEIWIISSNPVVMVGPGDTRQIFVRGRFSDGVERNLTDPSTGTTYTSSDTSIVQVDEFGNLMPQALEDSETTVIVQNGGLQAVLDVIVLGIPLDEIFDDRFQVSQ
jgi:hypothetical protein